MKQPHRIIYGTMRMLEVKRSLSKWIYIFDEMREKGIVNFHISKEYKSYKLFLEIVRKSNFYKKDVNIYAKCFSPNFDDKEYDAKKLNQLLDNYLSDLKIGSVHMQWMWRANLDNDQMRCSNLSQKIGELDYSFLKLKKNKINEIYCFPYSIKFGRLVEKIKSIDGLAIYFNPKEKSFKKILGKKNIGIRPLYSGYLNQRYSFKYLMNYSLKEKKIVKTILSINKLRNFKNLYNFLDD